MFYYGEASTLLNVVSHRLIWDSEAVKIMLFIHVMRFSKIVIIYFKGEHREFPVI